MIAYRTSGAIVAAFTVFALSSLPAAAAKKITYEDAWAKCKVEIGANVPWGDTNMSAARYTAGSACMKKYGYRLKK